MLEHTTVASHIVRTMAAEYAVMGKGGKRDRSSPNRIQTEVNAKIVERDENS